MDNAAGELYFSKEFLCSESSIIKNNFRCGGDTKDYQHFEVVEENDKYII